MLVALAQGALSLTLSSAWFAAGPVIVAPPTDATGTCPSGADVEAALSARFPGSVRASTIQAAPGQLRLDTRLASGQVRLELRNDRGEVVLRRQLPREGREGECRALAESIALIVDRYLHALLPEGATPAPERERPRETVPATPPAPAPRPNAAPTPPPAAPPKPNASPTPPAASPEPTPDDPGDERVETTPRAPVLNGEPPAEAPPPAPARAPAPPVVTKPPEAIEGPATNGRAATVLSAYGGDRLGDGSPGMSWEGRLSLQRLGALPGRGWIAEVQAGAGLADSATEDGKGTIRLNRFPARVAIGRSWPLGLGQFEASVGGGGDLLLRSFSPSIGRSETATREVTFAPIVDVHGGFRTLLSDRLSLSLGVNVGWALRRYDVGFKTSEIDRRGLLETPRFFVTPMLGLGLKIM